MAFPKVHLELGAANYGPVDTYLDLVLAPLFITLDELGKSGEPWVFLANDYNPSKPDATLWVANMSLEYITRKGFHNVEVRQHPGDYTSTEFSGITTSRTHIKNPDSHILSLIRKGSSFIHYLIRNSETGVEIHTPLTDSFQASLRSVGILATDLGLAGYSYFMPSQLRIPPYVTSGIHRWNLQLIQNP